jgi:hypothetical protein
VTNDQDDRDLWLDSFGDTWERLETLFVHVARADEGDNPNLTIGRHSGPIDTITRNYGPMTPIGEQP